MKRFIVSLMLVICSHLAFANALEKTSLSELQVIRAETKWNYGLLELKGKDGSIVLVRCPDLIRIGVNASIRLQFFDEQGRTQVRTYGGHDFYCYGTQDLIPRNLVGAKVNFNLIYSETAVGPLVTYASVATEEDGVLARYDFQKRGGTRWQLLPAN